MPRITPLKKQDALSSLGMILIKNASNPSKNRAVSEYYQWCKKFRSRETFVQTKRLFKGLL